MNVRALQKNTNERSDATRKRLVEAGLELFGLNGFEGTTTRALADIAQVNLAAIPYHFGGKDGLYRAVGHAVMEGLAEHMNGFLDEIEREIQGGVASPDQAAVMIERMLADFAEVALTQPQAERWTRFMLREQMEPTEVFDVLYDSPVRRMRGLMITLLSMVSGLEKDHPRLMLTAFQLQGTVYIFRLAQSSIFREMKWNEFDNAAYLQARALVIDNARIILRGLQTKGRG